MTKNKVVEEDLRIMYERMMLMHVDREKVSIIEGVFKDAVEKAKEDKAARHRDAQA